ncbi:hypothetical protein DX873_06040 [Flagellimonas nanhaiensis]|uniref:Uncharacterized protein n=1 Tax=Flagellimonas nanhaiensis TaxID=2292706 RepID=A0A371JWE0_9FLAO|nr:hypothetical protein DX873_06040 [Allomuricauda nanhaiensis]
MWIIAIAVSIFLLLNFLFYVNLNGYVKKEFGKRMWKLFGNKLYFWQSSVFVSLVGTVFIMYVLKCSDILIF